MVFAVTVAARAEMMAIEVRIMMIVSVLAKAREKS